MKGRKQWLRGTGAISAQTWDKLRSNEVKRLIRSLQNLLDGARSNGREDLLTLTEASNSPQQDHETSTVPQQHWTNENIPEMEGFWPTLEEVMGIAENLPEYWRLLWKTAESSGTRWKVSENVRKSENLEISEIRAGNRWIDPERTGSTGRILDRFSNS